MPASEKLSIHSCTHAIEDFLSHIETVSRDKFTALNELVYYYIGHNNTANTPFVKSKDPIVTDIQAICESTDQTTRSNFLIALTATCYKYADHVNLPEIFSEKYSAATVIAAFHEALLHTPNSPLKLTLDLSALTESTEKKRAIISFCIRVFAPELIICGSIVDERNKEKLHQLNNMITSLSTRTAFTYKACILGKLGSKEMPVFLFSITKATRLIIEDDALNRWTSDDLKHFIDTVQQNQHLISLSLHKTQLNKCCTDEKKFKFILQLLGIAHLKVLTLHHNFLLKLPAPQLEQLQAAIKASPIATIEITKPHRRLKSTASEGGMFAPKSDSNPDNEPKPKPSRHVPSGHVPSVSNF